MSAAYWQAKDPLLTPAEAAKRFGVSTRTVGRWRLEGLLPSVRTPGGSFRYEPEIVEAVIEARRSQGCAA